MHLHRIVDYFDCLYFLMKNILLPLIFIILSIPSAHAQVVISEVHWPGTDLSSADEWIELAVLEGVDASGWYITSVNSSGEEKIIAALPEDQKLQSRQFYIISNYGQDQSRLPVIPDLVTSSVSLPNSKLLLRLYTASGILIDTVDDGVGQPFGGMNSTEYRSMERIDLYTAGTQETNWQTASQSFYQNIFGSPGEQNPIESSTSTPLSTSSVSSQAVEELPDIRITEVMANPEGKDEDVEWIELWNAGEEMVYLQDMKLRVNTKEFIFTNSTLALNKGEYIYLLQTYTSLPLSNKGDTIQLLSKNNELIDELEYAETAEGVSYGIFDNSFQPLCMPSPGKSNTKVEQKIIIEVQSGKTRGTGSTTLNLQAKALNGSMNYVECYWEYSDGFRSMSCNPPAHTFADEGVFSVELRANNICGDSTIEVLHGKIYPEHNSSSSVSIITSSISSMASVKQSSTSSLQISSSSKVSQSYQLEVEISEIYPSPNSGEDEWIEIFNPTSHNVELAGWYLDDVAEEGSKPWQIPEDFPAIKSQEYVLFYRAKTKLALNNTGDFVRLIDPNGTERIALEYPSIKKRDSYIFTPACTSQQPTPGTENKCKLPVPKIAAATTQIAFTNSDPKQGNYEKYVQKSYKNIVQDSAPEIKQKPLLLANFYPNTVLAGTIDGKDIKQTNYPVELLLYLLFIVPGWYFATKRRFRA